MRIILLVALSLIVSCNSTPSYNTTTFQYQYDPISIANKPIKKVILAPVSLGPPIRANLKKGERKTKALIKDYLESNGYEVLPNHHFENAWQQASRTYGNAYDASTGRLNNRAWKAAMVTTAKAIREKTQADAIIFAELVELDVQHSFSMKHYARWHGVTRKPHLLGTGNGVAMDFNWGQRIKGASVSVTIFDTQLKRIFTSMGGIDTLESINTKKSPAAFVRSKKILKNNDFIEEGIELAFHPFIKMDDYPGKPQAESNPPEK